MFFLKTNETELINKVRMVIGVRPIKKFGLYLFARPFKSLNNQCWDSVWQRTVSSVILFWCKNYLQYLFDFTVQRMIGSVTNGILQINLCFFYELLIGFQFQLFIYFLYLWKKYLIFFNQMNIWNFLLFLTMQGSILWETTTV